MNSEEIKLKCSSSSTSSNGRKSESEGEKPGTSSNRNSGVRAGVLKRRRRAGTPNFSSGRSGSGRGTTSTSSNEDGSETSSSTSITTTEAEYQEEDDNRSISVQKHKRKVFTLFRGGNKCQNKNERIGEMDSNRATVGKDIISYLGGKIFKTDTKRIDEQSRSDVVVNHGSTVFAQCGNGTIIHTINIGIALFEANGKGQSRIIHDVFEFGPDDERYKYLLRLIRGSAKRNICAICIHDDRDDRDDDNSGRREPCEQSATRIRNYTVANTAKDLCFDEYRRPHCHIIHSCLWHSSTCRCFGLPVWRRRIFPITAGPDTNSACFHVAALLQYYTTGGRQLIYVKIGTSYWRCHKYWTAATGRLFDRDKIISNKRYFEQAFRGTLQICACLHKVGGEIERQRHDVLQDVDTKSATTIGEIGWSGKVLPGAVCQFIVAHPTFPLNAIQQTTMWQNSKFKFLLSNDKCFQRGLQLAQQVTAKWKLINFIHLYRDNPPIFGAINCNFEDIYYTIDESLQYVDELLRYQLNVEEASEIATITQFLTELYNVCERIIPKKNCFYIFSEPSGGKNWFFDAILAFYLNVGNIFNFNRFQQFPFQDAENRRMLLWNEINFCPSAVDSIKMLLGGDTMHVNIKHQSHKPIYRTPVIVLSNRHMLKDPAFLDRMYMYRWKTAPFLQNLLKKPNPLFWPQILIKYNIMS